MMRWKKTIRQTGLICLAAAWPYLGTAAELPKPVLQMDFEDTPATMSPAGVGQSLCLDLSSPGKEPFVLKDPELLKNLAGIKSFTITGWVKKPVTFDDVNNAPPWLLACPGVFDLRFDNWGGLALTMEGADKSRKKIRSGKMADADLNLYNRWVFFAFTYDGTKQGTNGAFYYGYESYLIRRDRALVDGLAGDLNLTPPPFLAIGAGSPDGKQKLQGAVDSLKIFASSKDGSAALGQVEIENIRRRDVGTNYLRQLELQALDDKRGKKMDLMRLEDKFWSAERNLQQVDPLTRIFSNKCPPPVSPDFVPCVPKGGSLPVLFAAMIQDAGVLSAQIEVSFFRAENGVPLQLPFTTYEVLPVPVEANSNGGSITGMDTRPAEIWMEHQVAEAPFKIAEALRETQEVRLGTARIRGNDRLYHGILLDFDIPPDTKPGLYRGSLTLKTAKGSLEKTFSFQVADVAVNNFPKLNNVYWFTANPENLTTRTNLPALWSEEHWGLIKNSLKTLRKFGQTGITINLVSQNKEVINYIQTCTAADGTYRFDYKLFDRWFEMFMELGFQQVEGFHLFRGQTGGIPDVYALDEKTGQKVQIFSIGSSADDYFRFLEIFATDLCKHLDEKGWKKNYYQCLIDEPANLELYKRAKGVADKCLPGIPTKDACGVAAYSDYMDVQVFNMSLAKQSYQDLALKRRAAGKSGWLYHCVTPYPPNPNRHLDDPLTSSRLYPWIARLLNADGYLFWAANNYRGADPYKSSIGLLPGGAAEPGHSPGDNWMYYPGPDGLRGSMRMLAFREGLLDHALLEQLAAKDKSKAEQILKTIIRNPVDYSLKPSEYNSARKSLLEALEKADSKKKP